jgi:perosamine synthetase
MAREIPFGRPMIGEAERRAVAEVLAGTTLTHGPRVREFEQAFAAFTGASGAVATASCTASMHLVYLYLGIGPGDEVIVPTQTHTATAHCVELVGARCVFVDSEPRTGNIDLDRIEPLINERTKALAVVHYLGLPVDMDRVTEIARRHKLFVVEDCALALGTRYKGTHAGLLGDVGCFSFYPVKHITTGEGGMLISKHPEVSDAVSRLRAFGIDRNVVEDRKIPGMYDVQGIGLNYRLNEIGAALGIEQMKRLPDFLRRRRENHDALAAGLRQVQGIELLQSSHGHFESSYYCMVMLLPPGLMGRRPEVMEALKARGVGSSVYYPKPVPRMTYYRRKYGFAENAYPVASAISDRAVALPVGPHVDREDVDYMVSAVKDVLSGMN